jgi:soluble lytic murein transglycosylase
MTPTTATPPRRTAPRRSGSSASRVQQRLQRRRRRRRLLGGAVALAIIGIAVALMLPAAKQAVNDEFGLPLRYSSIIRQQAAAKRLDPALVAAVIYAETKFDPRTSPAGAEGLMQIEPATAEFLAHRSGATTFTTADLATPSVNIAYGSYFLRYLLDQYHGSRLLALAAYNGGAGNVDRWEAAAEAKGHSLTIAEIPFPETRAYVAKVLGAQGRYRRTYAHQLGYS